MTDTLNRRRLLAGTAAAALTAPVVAIPAFAGVSARDPVHAAIQAHRAAAEALGLTLDRLSDVQQQAIDAGIPWDDHPDMEAAEGANNAASDADHTALFDLAETVPTSREGATALAGYIGALCERDDWHEPATIALASLAAMLGGAGRV